MITDPVEINKREIFVLGDLLERLFSRTGEVRSSSRTSAMIRAVQDTLRQLPSKHDWSYYQRVIRFVTTAPIAPTCNYDFTGGASERLLTITSAHAFPADAEEGEVYFEGVAYRVEKRISSTQVTLRSDSCPLADFTAKEVLWARSSYPLPRRIARVHSLTCRDDGIIPLYYLSPQDFYTAQTLDWGSIGGPSRFTIKAISATGETGVVLSPAPEGAKTYEANVTVSPSIPTVAGVKGSDGAIASGSNVFNSATGQFTDRLLGAMLRIGIDAEYPVGDAFSHSFQAFVVRVVSSTQLELSEISPSAVSDAAFYISSPIDVDSDTMLHYVESESFAQFCRNHKHESLRDAMAISAGDLRSAIVADQQVNKIRLFEPYRHWPGDYGYWSSRYVYPY